jgi:hypothetical protein
MHAGQILWSDCSVWVAGQFGWTVKLTKVGDVFEGWKYGFANIHMSILGVHAMPVSVHGEQEGDPSLTNRSSRITLWNTQQMNNNHQASNAKEGIIVKSELQKLK